MIFYLFNFQAPTAIRAIKQQDPEANLPKKYKLDQ